MGDLSEPVLFDVGPAALAHAGTPVSDPALSYVRRAVAGELDAVVPYTALLGAHAVLTTYYDFSNAEAARPMRQFAQSRRIYWYTDVGRETVRSAFERVGESNVDGWDGYYAEVAVREGVRTVLTMDSDFDAVGGVAVETVLSSDERERLNDYLGY